MNRTQNTLSASAPATTATTRYPILCTGRRARGGRRPCGGQRDDLFDDAVGIGRSRERFGFTVCSLRYRLIGACRSRANGRNRATMARMWGWRKSLRPLCARRNPGQCVL